MSPPNTATVKILDKEYQVACPEEQEAELLTSAKYLDKQMRKIRNSGKVIGLERIAVMAALNISFELLHKDLVRRDHFYNYDKRSELCPYTQVPGDCIDRSCP